MDPQKYYTHLTMEEIVTPLVLVFEILTLLTCVVGDWMISSAYFVDFQWLRILADVSTHAVVGLLSWAIACNGLKYSVHPLFEVLLSGALAFAVDVDHVIPSTSMPLLQVLTGRPFHNSTLIPVISILLFFEVQCFCPAWLLPFCSNIPLIFFVSWSSHHIRDATRRGLWFAPFGTTPPLPTWLYRSLICTIPVLLRILAIFKSQSTRSPVLPFTA